MNDDGDELTLTFGNKVIQVLFFQKAKIIVFIGLPRKLFRTNCNDLRIPYLLKILIRNGMYKNMKYSSFYKNHFAGIIPF